MLDLAKKIAFKYTNFGAPRYVYNVEPIQLAAIIYELERLKDIPGNILEIGVARGMTTRFICEHIKNSSSIVPFKFFALDTFDSFTKKDIDWEVSQRGKLKNELSGFSYNDFTKWKSNFEEFRFLEAVQADCSTFDYAVVGPIKFAFLDVDLYLPTKNALPLVYEQLVDDGIILVDDVADCNRWDGAYQAYNEFCGDMAIEPQVIGNKCGVIRKIGNR